MRALVENIAAFSVQQDDGIKQISRAVHEVDPVTQQNAAQAEESAAACSSLHHEVVSQERLVNKLRAFIGAGESKPRPKRHPRQFDDFRADEAKLLPQAEL